MVLTVVFTWFPSCCWWQTGQCYHW